LRGNQKLSNDIEKKIKEALVEKETEKK
jgi:hypothetical protein